MEAVKIRFGLPVSTNLTTPYIITMQTKKLLKAAGLFVALLGIPLAPAQAASVSLQQPAQT